jgi:flavin-dependent dehydrogenase
MKRYDVIICGGGIAGLSCARQLKRGQPELSIKVIEREAGPIGPAAHKVGEATVEGGARYLTEHLGLTGYFNREHLHKLGLRMYTGASDRPLWQRPELGTRKFARVPSYQVDRGMFENRLRKLVVEDGIELVEGGAIKDVDLGDADAPHVVHYDDPDGTERDAACRFLVDATGRRRLLNRKLGLARPSEHQGSAAWWRLQGEYDVENMDAPAPPQWKPPTQERRWFSTNHFMGKGYWIWMIPLASGNTSVGIVADERVFPSDEYSSFAKAMAWVAAREPRLYDFIKDGEVLDFRRIKNYAYQTSQVFSAQRWACVGEAALFLDPFYSPGMDFIAYTNTIACRLVELDRQRALTQGVADRFNRFMLEDLVPYFTALYKNNWSFFGSTAVMATKVIWDTCFYWAFPCPMLFGGHLVDPHALDDFHEVAQEFLPIQLATQAAFRRWGEFAQEPADYLFTDYGKVPMCARLHLDLLATRNRQECIREMRANLATFRGWSDQIGATVEDHHNNGRRRVVDSNHVVSMP